MVVLTIAPAAGWWLRNERRYGQLAEGALEAIVAAKNRPLGRGSGLFPLLLNAEFGTFVDARVGLGGMGDSFYETLLKARAQS